MAKYVCGIDAGTTGCTVMITDLKGNVVGTAYREYPCTYPQAGWVEQDMDLVWEKICEASREVIAKTGVDPKEIGSLGFSSQRGTFVCIDKDWNCLHNSIVWNDNRGSQEELPRFKAKMSDERYIEIAGTAMYANWALFKIMWVMNNRPQIWEKTWKVVNGQEWFLHKLGSEEIFSDPSSLTLNGMMEIDKLDWSEEICRLAGIPMDKLPPVKTPMRQVGVISKKAAEETGFAPGMPICVGGGDQQCAAIGSGVIKEGMAEITVGTGAVMVAHADSRKPDPEGRIMFGGHAIPNKWDIEGNLHAAAATLRWFRDNFAQVEGDTARKLGMDVYDLITAQAAQAPAGCKGFIFFPFFTGQVTPNYVHNARGGGLGLSFMHDRGMLARAILEGCAFEMRMIVEAMETVLDAPFDVIGLSGGAAKSPLWNQIQSDVYGRPVQLFKVSECTTLGATILGATAAGIFNNIEEAVDNMVQVVGYLEPNMKNHALYTDLYGLFKDTFQTLAGSGIYDKVVAIQDKYWGGGNKE
ncbi:MAG: FGGY family carbohydrate kinase [bacterium]|jgi:xylulokinase|nr:FGGY family carbohydrate kinase [Bacillota bacterium]